MTIIKTFRQKLTVLRKKSTSHGPADRYSGMVATCGMDAIREAKKRQLVFFALETTWNAIAKQACAIYRPSEIEFLTKKNRAESRH
jgi:hypothetical protein